ncbi:MAG TPA: sigma-54 dependent transcriptional regulator [Candidatus Barnesiella excrementipullorum]|uniref:Sigma-54 dependent transcriptional regulator n=1 Tax=Candidatus Barnesiella excrementipullorum TaxID=2838479 RepID=A0A9D1VPU1_9BACT|nr:sigma-54 dependent transcriptional regulator [Candidatus Barnesiella excrementipullorum]
MMTRKRLLIIEDDATFSLMLRTWLEKKGFDVAVVSTLLQSKKILSKGVFDLVLCDLRLPDGEGVEVLEWMHQQGCALPLIMMTHYADIQSAVQSMKLGACDYVSKPVNPDMLLQKINEALAAAVAVGSQNKSVAGESSMQPQDSESPEYLEGESEAARQLYNYVRLVAPTNMSVLINGASGTGKEYVARRIHELSNRSAAPFIAVDCGVIMKDLAASEFFGHKKGSFTGAIEDKTGAFVAANGGTIFLDEIGNLSYDVQVQLLRVLQERKVRPIGSNSEIAVDVRLVAATNEDLRAAIKEGRFREDLYHRINEFSIKMPLLCEREDDIIYFADFFLDKANKELGRDIIGFSPEAVQLIRQYTWPGNLRQMANVVKRAVLLAQGRYIAPRELDIEVNAAVAAPISVTPLRDSDDERQRIIEALRVTGNNKSKAAELLQIDRKTLYNKMKLYGL